MTSLARAERAALADQLEAVGPDAPTLCEGWSTRDLAAHVLVRERRPDAAGGISIPLLAGRTAAVQAGYARRSWSELVELVRGGPPSWSPLGLGPVDHAFNLTEFFVHAEDVRRAQPGWVPRVLSSELDAALWKALRARARAFYRKAPVGVVLRRDLGDGVHEDIRAREGGPGEPGVVVIGVAQELVLHAMGRTGNARIRVEGSPEALRLFASTSLTI